MASDLGVERFTTDWREVVEDPAVDVVAVLLGETAHREATEAALALGKPVLCEKPLGRDRFEAAAMLGQRAERASRRRAASTTATCRRCAWRVEIVDSGRLGRCLQFRAVYLQDHAAGDVAEPPAERLPSDHRLLPTSSTSCATSATRRRRSRRPRPS